MRDTAKSPPTETVVWDREVTGLGQRHRARVRPVWIFQMRKDGRSRKHTLGSTEALSVEEARAAARVLLEEPPVAALWPDRLEPFADAALRDLARQWKPSTLEGARRAVRRKILPRLGDVAVTALTRSAVVRWHEGLTGSVWVNQHALAILSALLLHAERVGLRPPGTNPCKGLRKRITQFAGRYLSEAEYRRLGKALGRAREEDAVVTDLIRFIALTGCRMGEARLLTWDRVDGPRAVLPDAKGGRAAIRLAPPVRALLARRGSDGPFVFGGARPVGTVRLYKRWHRIRASARLKGLRLHDLRHSFAATAIGIGEDLRTIGGLLGHRALTVPEGYAHLAEGPLKAAAGRVGLVLGGALAPEAPPADPPKAAARAQKAASEANPLVKRFAVSALSLTRFCAAHGLDRDAFGAEVRAWRKVHRRATRRTRA